MTLRFRLSNALFLATISIGASIGASSIVFSASCDSADESEDEGDAQRGEIGKADLVGSCENTTCDGPAPGGTCWCDVACQDFGDCCADYASACGEPTPCEQAGGMCVPGKAACPIPASLPEDPCGPNAEPVSCCGAEIPPPLNPCEEAGGICMPGEAACPIPASLPEDPCGPSDEPMSCCGAEV
jgi:hypothetical protein